MDFSLLLKVAGKCEDLGAKWRSVSRRRKCELCQMLLVGQERCGLWLDTGFSNGEVLVTLSRAFVWQVETFLWSMHWYKEGDNVTNEDILIWKEVHFSLRLQLINGGAGSALVSVTLKSSYLLNTAYWSPYCDSSSSSWESMFVFSSGYFNLWTMRSFSAQFRVLMTVWGKAVGMVGDGGEIRGGSGDKVEVGSTRWDLFT